ncbi:unnamed protein product [Caenorhabditis auriculariae]|uniref:Uncharacterized protein n=1 Tax=Caenorhabditis auriculariae TaxID=2777116 RepID=A0A8S1HPE7_9PELO|nr:unnamed protein product [Caenorhabditis auriculariae]
MVFRKPSSVDATDHQIGRGPVGVRQDPGENQEISFTWFEPKIGSNMEPRSEALCYRSVGVPSESDRILVRTRRSAANFWKLLFCRI